MRQHWGRASALWWGGMMFAVYGWAAGDKPPRYAVAKRAWRLDSLSSDFRFLFAIPLHSSVTLESEAE